MPAYSGNVFVESVRSPGLLPHVNPNSSCVSADCVPAEREMGSLMRPSSVVPATQRSTSALAPDVDICGHACRQALTSL